MSQPAHADEEPSDVGALLHAARPRTLPAAATPVLVGTAIAYADGQLAVLEAFVALVCALLIQVGTNFANDYFDYKKGADTEDRVGETRVTQAGLVEPDEVKRWMIGAFALAIILGVYLVSVGGWPILAIGLASVAAAILYTGGPWPYGYHGLGDPFVFVFFGLVAVAGTYYVQALAWSPTALWAGAGIGALATAILAVNNMRDIPTDREAGKRTLAVLLGRTGARIEYVALLVLAAAVPVVLVTVYGRGLTVLAALGAVPFAVGPAREVLTTADPEVLDAQLPRTARLLAIYGLLLAGGIAL